MALKEIHPSNVLEDLLTQLVLSFYDSCVIRTYSNNYTPLLTSVIGDFTESTYPGYGGIVATPWSVAYDGIDSAVAVSPFVEFVCTGGGGQNVYGVFVTAGGALLYAQRLDPADGPVPVVMVNGQRFKYTPRVKLRNIP